MRNSIKGLLIGSILGALNGLGVCLWLIDETFLFPGDAMIAGALICGTCGYAYADEFFEWLKDNWDAFL